MRRLLITFCISTLLVGCGKEEREKTREVLASAYTVRETVADLDGRYARAFQSTGTPEWIEKSASGWEGVIAFRESAEGVEVKKLLTPYARPLPINAGYRRAADIRELSLVSAELVALALEPRGTWISFGEEMNSIRTRFDRALLALESGTKDYILIEAKAEAQRRIRAYADALVTAVAKADEEKRRADAERAQAGAAAERAREAGLLKQSQREDERAAETIRKREEARRKALDESFKLKMSSPGTAAPSKLGGGAFPTPRGR
jgi:hypothetical protein